MKPYGEVKKRLLKNKAVRRAYKELGPEFALVESLIQKRIQQGYTQAALARKTGTKQSAIARLESGTYNPTVGFLGKIAKALDGRLVISISERR